MPQITERSRLVCMLAFESHKTYMRLDPSLRYFISATDDAESQRPSSADGPFEQSFDFLFCSTNAVESIEIEETQGLLSFLALDEQLGEENSKDQRADQATSRRI